MPQINNHKDLIQSYFYWNAWNQDESFDLKKLKNSQKDELRNVEIIEVLFEAESSGENLLAQYIEFLNGYFIRTDIPSYLFVSEFCKKQKSKLRSYKGNIKEELMNVSDFTCEIEVDLPDGYSLFGAVIEINEFTNHLVPKFFLTNSNSFAINFGSKIDDKKLFIENVVNEYLINEENYSFVNYAKLVLNFCAEKTVIFRTGGDGGTSEISFQAFVNNETKDLVLIQAEIII